MKVTNIFTRAESESPNMFCYEVFSIYIILKLLTLCFGMTKRSILITSYYQKNKKMSIEPSEEVIRRVLDMNHTIVIFD